MDILRQEKTFPCRHWFKTGFCGERASRWARAVNARGFRNFKNYRTRILFFCGTLSLAP